MGSGMAESQPNGDNEVLMEPTMREMKSSERVVFALEESNQYSSQDARSDLGLHVFVLTLSVLGERRHLIQN